MSKDQRAKQEGRRGPVGQEGRRDRLDTIEVADDHTEHLNPHRGGVATDPIEDMLDEGESNAAYKDEADRVTPTLGPVDQSE